MMILGHRYRQYMVAEMGTVVAVVATVMTIKRTNRKKSERNDDDDDDDDDDMTLHNNQPQKGTQVQYYNNWIVRTKAQTGTAEHDHETSCRTRTRDGTGEGTLNNTDTRRDGRDKPRTHTHEL